MKRLLVLVVVIVIFVGALSIWWSNGIVAVNPQDKSEKIFVVQKGTGVRELAYQLKREGLIKDPVVFFLLVRKLGLDGKLQAGDFKLSPSMTASQIAQNLTHGTLDIWVTIPEGKRATEIALILREKIPSYNDSWRAKLDFEEGYLFPDTYLIPRSANIDFIVSLLTDTFNKKYDSIRSQKLVTYSKKDVVTIASLVEREAKFTEDRPLVASVIYNRLNIGMALQIDATIQYALGYQPKEKSWWKKKLSEEDLNIVSLYNTYRNTGLPPTPIASPGVSSLQAAINPAKTDYLYYISDKEGHNHYAKTLEEHNALIRKYSL